MTDAMARREALNKQRDQKWVSKSIQQAALSSTKARDTLTRLLDLDGARFCHDVLDERINEGLALFETLAPAKRKKLFTTIFGELTPFIECVWDNAGQRSYLHEWPRFPFRAPSRVATIEENRVRFFLDAAYTLGGRECTPIWFLQSVPFLESNAFDLSVLDSIAGAMIRDEGEVGELARATLVAAVQEPATILEFSGIEIEALLLSSSREHWEVVGKLLLAAQRQEGLRQAVFDAVKGANKDAFRYMLGLIVEHDLARFSATIAAFDEWFGMQWAGGSVKPVKQALAWVIDFFDDDEKRKAAIDSGSAEELYFALWVTAFDDAEEVLPVVRDVLCEDDVARQWAALQLARGTQLWPDLVEILHEALKDCERLDPRIEMLMVTIVQEARADHSSAQLFNTIERLYQRSPKRKRTEKSIVWPWDKIDIGQRTVAECLCTLGERVPDKLIPYVTSLDGWRCANIVAEMVGVGEYYDRDSGKRKKRKRDTLSPEQRELLLKLAVDTRVDVQRVAFAGLEKEPIRDDELAILLDGLHRSAPTFRMGALKRLARLPVKKAIDAIDQLLGDRNQKKQAAGLELAGTLIEKGKQADAVRNVIQSHRGGIHGADLLDTVKRLVGSRTDVVHFTGEDDALGLSPAERRSKLPKPKYRKVQVRSKLGETCLLALADWLVEHAEIEVEVSDEDGQTHRGLLGGLGWKFPSPNPKAVALDDARQRLPLYDEFHAWLTRFNADLKDKDGAGWVHAWCETWHGDAYIDRLPEPYQRRYAWDIKQGLAALLKWAARLTDTGFGAQQLLQFYENALARDEPHGVEERAGEKHYFRDEVISTPAYRWSLYSRFASLMPAQVSAEMQRHFAVLTMLAFERGEPLDVRVRLPDFVLAFDAGMLNEYDLAWVLLRPVKKERFNGVVETFGPIGDVSQQKMPPIFATRPALANMIETMRQRLIDVELTRGEQASSASVAASELKYSGGVANLGALVKALGRDKLIRQDQWGEPTRAYSFSRLIKVSAPSEGDSAKTLKATAKANGISEKRLVEVAMYAPQWAGLVETALSQPGLADAIWWIHAHTKQEMYWRDDSYREQWAAQIGERTELAASDLEEGAVDVAWFLRAIETLGTAGWEALQAPAKYASNSGGHKRAQLFADAMLDRVTLDELRRRIDEKRHQDAVRALGLVPLPKQPKGRQAETLERYQRLQEFKRESRQFGSMRQTSEGRAVEIAMQNLARTAGYRDPQRLQWAMEAEAVADLARGPITVAKKETRVTLALDDDGAPELSVVKKDRPLKNVPAALRKDKDIVALRARVKDLRRQRARMRLSLEAAMCRGDRFTAEELRQFFDHPMLRPMVERLVFIGDGDLIGYPTENGKLLRAADGRVEPVGKRDEVRIAHSFDLLQRGDWSSWQRECFSAERVQPFKQVFRETYPKTKAESDGSDMSRRYAGHQVQPRQALALLKARQWLAVPDEGIRKTFHDENLIAELWFQHPFFTAADVEDLTLEAVAFVKRNAESYTRVPLTEVPERLFSEVMRDLDLVVGVAHAGGIDPEASASTIEMRARLVSETCQLLRLNNVRVDGNYIKIDGKRESYSVHLGSATTSVLPGSVLIIVAVHSQYRGRLFLPFADDDPKTAEVLAKTLLLARDEEIKDPSILAQIRG